MKLNILNLDKYKKIFTASLIATFVICVTISCEHNRGVGIVERINKLDKDNRLIVQMAELEIDSSQLETYLRFLRQEIQISVDTEPGVLTLYSMVEEDDPTKIRVIEIYASQEAYESHIASLHFQKYKKGTLNMVHSLKLTRMNPIIFAAKPK